MGESKEIFKEGDISLKITGLEMKMFETPKFYQISYYITLPGS